jgi:hypothetical protein
LQTDNGLSSVLLFSKNLFYCAFSILGYVGKINEKNTNVFDITKD